MLFTWQFGMGWRRGFAKGQLCGKYNLSLRERESLLFGVHCLACLSTTCPCSICQEWLDRDQRRSKGTFFGGRGFREEASPSKVGGGLFKQKKGRIGCQMPFYTQQGLLCKWSWHYAVERGALWEQVIGRKFGVEEGGWSTQAVREGYGVGLWKEISKEGFLLSNKIGFSMSNREE